ncbi:MAG: 50S ribosomal protein L25/general stress protein Ctc [Spirochaetaceae bacterium 4572_59]|nr:MAG: 50S ribosomal protein L25/general stress protein Ctc [Spirochaetaceae bacterium 4572_59]
MEQKTLSVVERKEFKKGPAKQLRKEGKIPAVVYGHTEPLHISVDAREFSKKFKVVTENTIIVLEMDGKKIEVLVKALQEDIVKESVEHIDFYEIEKGKLLKTHVPVHTVGNPIGVKEGGMLEQIMNRFEVECLPVNLPEEISINIEKMDMGSSIHVRDIALPEGVRVLDAEDATVVVVSIPKAEVVESDEEDESEEAAASTEG